MKNILKVIVLISFAMFQFFGCKQIEDLKDSEKVAYITINNSLARTAMPELSIEKMTNFLLKGTFSGEEEQELGTWDNAKSLKTAKIFIKPGLWDFKLTSQQGGVSFSATIEKKQIEVALNNLEFNLSVSSMDLQNGKGSINISFTELKNTLASVTAEFFYLDRSSTNLSKEDLKVEATEEISNAVLNMIDVPSGTYLIDFVFYSDAEKTVKLGTYTELVNVTANCISSAVIKNLDLANLYQITYDLNGGNFSDGFTAPASYSSCSSIELPLAANVIKTGYELDGWYFESPDDIFDGNFQGMTGDKKLYAKWKCGTSNFTVNHYQQNIRDDKYTLFETEVLTGTTDSLSVATSKNYTGFTAKEIEQKNVSADGKTVVDIYYDRKIITITLSPGFDGKEKDERKGRYGAYSRICGQFLEDTTIAPLLTRRVDIPELIMESTGKTRKSEINSFYIADTETTKRKWREVYDWAISNERGEKKYKYIIDINKEIENSEKPMDYADYDDVIVWCNAISEKEGLSPVYLIKDSKTPIRDSTSVWLLNNKNQLIIDENANGYRLPTPKEWEVAAYYEFFNQSPHDGSYMIFIKDYPFEYNSISDNYNLVLDTSCSKNVFNDSVYYDKDNKREPSFRGLYDMVGNVAEYVFIDFRDYACFGGYYRSSKKNATRENLTNINTTYLNSTRGVVGFRLVRSFEYDEESDTWKR
mgnify:CR=1 FL=1